MGLNERSPDTGEQGQAAHTFPIARSFALVILVALAGLFILHHLVFNVSVTGGVK
jgi:hypothetical protein